MKPLILLAALLCAVPAMAFDLILFAPRPKIEAGATDVTMIWGIQIMLWDTDEMEWTP